MEDLRVPHQEVIILRCLSMLSPEMGCEWMSSLIHPASSPKESCHIWCAIIIWWICLYLLCDYMIRETIYNKFSSIVDMLSKLSYVFFFTLCLLGLLCNLPYCLLYLQTVLHRSSLCDVTTLTNHGLKKSNLKVSKRMM